MGGSCAKQMVFSEAVSRFDSITELSPLTRLFRNIAHNTSESTDESNTQSSTNTTATNNIISQYCVDRDAFLKLLQDRGLQLDIANDIFRVFAGRNNTQLSYESFISAMGSVCKGDIYHINWLYFEMLDREGVGFITRIRFVECIRSLIISAESSLFVDLLGIIPSLNDLVAASKGSRNASILPGEFHPAGNTHDIDGLRSNETFNRSIDQITRELFNNDSIDRIDAKQLCTWLQSHAKFVQYLTAFFTKFYVTSYELPIELKASELPRPMMTFNGVSELMSTYDRCVIKAWLSKSFAACNLVMLFSTTQHGFSLSSMYDRSITGRSHDLVPNPSLIIVQDTDGRVFGAFIGERWKRRAMAFHGYSEHTFMFSLRPRIQQYGLANKSQNHLYSSGECFGIGGHAGRHGLMLDDALMFGGSNACDLFSSPALSASEFRVKTVEVWGLVDAAHLPIFLDAKQSEDDGSVLDRTDQLYVLGLIGRGYSQMLD